MGQRNPKNQLKTVVNPIISRVSTILLVVQDFATIRRINSITMLPSGKRLHNYGTSPFFWWTIHYNWQFSIANCNKLPEGSFLIAITINSITMLRTISPSLPRWSHWFVPSKKKDLERQASERRTKCWSMLFAHMAGAMAMGPMGRSKHFLSGTMWEDHHFLLRKCLDFGWGITIFVGKININQPFLSRKSSSFNQITPISLLGKSSLNGDCLIVLDCLDDMQWHFYDHYSFWWWHDNDIMF